MGSLRGGSSSSATDKRISFLLEGLSDVDAQYISSILGQDEPVEKKEGVLKVVVKEPRYEMWKKEMAIGKLRDILGRETMDDATLERLIQKLTDSDTRSNFNAWCTNLDPPENWPTKYVYDEAKRILAGESQQSDEGFVFVPPIPRPRNKDEATDNPGVSEKKIKTSPGSNTIENRKTLGKGTSEGEVCKTLEEDETKESTEGTQLKRSHGNKTTLVKGSKIYPQLHKGVKGGESSNTKTTKNGSPDDESESDDSVTPKKKRFFEQEGLDKLNILLVGDSGVGKTTFVNGVANYAEFQSLKESMKNGPNVLISTQFTICNKDNKPVTITANSNYETTKNLKHNENLGGRGESVTQRPVTHTLLYKLRGSKINVNFIDTPGINDTRGPDQDHKNLEDIRTHIQSLDKLNAIIILLTADQQKMTMQFRHSLNELLSNFDKDSLKNLIFCYTKTRSNGYKPGDALVPLREYLNEQKARSGVNIPIARDNIFCFDNECFRYLCMVRQFPDCRNPKIDDDLQECWAHNTNELNRLLSKVKGLEGYKLSEATDFVKLKKILRLLSDYQIKIARLVADSNNNWNEIYDSMKVNANRTKALHEKLKENDRRTNQPRPIVYCRIHNKDCHHDIPESIIRHMESIDYATMNKLSMVFDRHGSCKACQCLYNHHAYLQNEVSRVPVFDPQNDKELQMCNQENIVLKQRLMDQQAELEKLTAEKNKILQFCAELRIHIKYKSSTDTTDELRLKFTEALNIESEKNEISGDNKLLNTLLEMLKYYEEELVRISDEVKQKTRNILTEHEIMTQFFAFQGFEKTGKILAECLVHFNEDRLKFLRC